ncbi:hypothetical protein QM306_33990, partial [Burkholderia cenocepacia]|nr:hypothetical protein [Burkholderia cenocepacia]
RGRLRQRIEHLRHERVDAHRLPRELERTEAKFARQPVRINPLVSQVLDSLAEAAALRRFVWELCRGAVDASSGGQLEVRTARHDPE